MGRQGVRFTDDATRRDDDYCQRCGFTRPPEDLRSTTVQAPGNVQPPMLTLRLCGKCRRILNGKVTR